LYYSLGDETGIADLSAYWDFDLSPASVVGFHTWLHERYGSLAALNAEWVRHTNPGSRSSPRRPRTMRRADDNFAAWNDFKEWMDRSFADALRFGTNAIHRANPAALSAIEGVQIPGWALRLHEARTRCRCDGDFRRRRESGDPAFAQSARDPAGDELRRFVRRFAPHLARGTARRARPGAVDEEDGIARADASVGPRGQAYAPLFAALRGPIGRRMIDAEPVRDSVAMLYSPVSFRVRWMLDHRRDGDAWMHRSSETELEDNAWRVSMRDYRPRSGGSGCIRGS